MKQETVLNLFKNAHIEIVQLVEISNQYWPHHTDYQAEAYANPWWLIRTRAGVLMMGHRKNVTHLEWQLTDIRVILTQDQTPQSSTHVHAWGLDKLQEYLNSLAVYINQY